MKNNYNRLIPGQFNPGRATTKGGLRLFAAVSLLWLLPALACGSFAPRVTLPTPTVSTAEPFFSSTEAATADAGNQEAGTQPVPQVTQAPLPADTPAPEPTATFTATPPPGTALQAGQPARVTAPAGLNMRTDPTSSAALLLQLATGVRVTITEGPVSAENYTWWRIDDGQGNVGWAADGDGETQWLSPQIGEAQAVDRAPRLDDRVTVSIQLSIRALPGPDAPLLLRVDPGQQFTVLDGPQSAGGFTWYRIRSDDGQIEGWAADSDGTTRWLSPLE